MSGIKRHLAVDSRGLPHMPSVTTANISDKVGAKEVIARREGELEALETVLVDGAYNGGPFEEYVGEALGAEVEVARRSEPHTFAVIPKRRPVGPRAAPGPPPPQRARPRAGTSFSPRRFESISHRSGFQRNPYVWLSNGDRHYLFSLQSLQSRERKAEPNCGDHPSSHTLERPLTIEN